MSDDKMLGTKVTVKIGRTGVKNHPAWADELGNGRFRVTMFACCLRGLGREDLRQLIPDGVKAGASEAVFASGSPTTRGIE